MSVGGYLGGWFGEDWGSPLCDDPDRHRATPVGEPCTGCLVPVEAGDQGLIIPLATVASGTVLTATHAACFRAAVGYRRSEPT